MSTDSVPTVPAWHVLLVDLVAQTTGSGLVPTPYKLTDLSHRYHSPLAEMAFHSTADARSVADHLAPGYRPAAAEPTVLDDGRLCVSIHIEYRGWWLIVSGTDPAPDAMAVAAACLTPDAPALPYVSGDLGDR